MRKFIGLALGLCVFLIFPVLVAAQVSSAGDTGMTTPVDSLSDFAMWGIVAGFVGTWVVALINRENWPSEVKFGVFFAWCLMTAAIDAYFKRELDLGNWVRALLVVFVAGQTTYIAGKPAIKSIEAKT